MTWLSVWKAFSVASCIVFLGATESRAGEEQVFQVGDSDLTTVLPSRARMSFESVLFTQRSISVEFDGKTRSIRVFSNGVEVAVEDEVFHTLRFVPFFLLRESYRHLGTEDPPLECQTLEFQVEGHDSIEGGGFEMCEKQATRLVLWSGACSPNNETVVIYDSAISNELQPEGFWKEIGKESEIPN